MPTDPDEYGLVYWTYGRREYTYDRPLAMTRIGRGKCPRCGSDGADCPVCLGYDLPDGTPEETAMARLSRWRSGGHEVIGGPLP